MDKTLLKPTKTKLPDINPGDIVRIHQKIKEGTKERIQVFEGIVIKTHGKSGPSATFTVRKIASGVGVERVYPLNSPSIVKIEFKKSSRVRRAKLYYLRNLSGKALRMKDKKVDKDIWELVVQNEKEEATEEHLAEAVEAAAVKEEKEKGEEAVDSQTGDKSEKDDTVKEEENSGKEKEDQTKSEA